MIRSIKTLGVRALRHGLNALRIAHWLSRHPAIEDVRYPGLSSSVAFNQVEELLSANAQKELEFLGWEFPYQIPKVEDTSKEGTLSYVRSLGVPFGGMIAFRLKGADEGTTGTWLTSLRLISLAESLGGVESLIEAPYGMTHAVSISQDLMRSMTNQSVSASDDEGKVRDHTESDPIVSGNRRCGRLDFGSGPGIGTYSGLAVKTVMTARLYAWRLE
jgi:O-acetylhomoserine/O-acetylserine sulfhydrylase-like pyridoxal-dependent enzyme